MKIRKKNGRRRRPRTPKEKARADRPGFRRAFPIQKFPAGMPAPFMMTAISVSLVSEDDLVPEPVVPGLRDIGIAKRDRDREREIALLRKSFKT
jgi:hypothetical protein